MNTSITVIWLLSSVLVSLIAFLSEEAETSSRARTPSLQYCETADRKDLGEWDDVFSCEHMGKLLCRRGTSLYIIPGPGPDDMQKLITVPILDNTRIVGSADVQERFWLFLNSSEKTPFALDLHSGKVSEFVFPNLDVWRSQIPSIRSRVLVQHANACLFKISGGGPSTWPGGGNRPVYFWMSLKSGKVIRFPIGWDLDYLSGDQRIAVFAKPQEKKFQRRPLQAVDVESGQYSIATPERGSDPCIPYVWNETQMVMPLYIRRAETNAREYFSGVSALGQTLPFTSDLTGVHYMSTARMRDGFVGFRLRREGSLKIEPCSVWMGNFHRGQEPKLISTRVTGFAILDGGKCAFISAGHGPRRKSEEVWFYDQQENSRWNVLDAVERLPALDKEFVNKEYIADHLGARIIPGTGRSLGIALCVFSHTRHDMRAFSPLVPAHRGKKPLTPVTWRRAILISSDGERYMTNLFREGNLPEFIWLHNSGKLIMCDNFWKVPGSARHRKVRLSGTKLRWEDGKP